MVVLNRYASALCFLKVSWMDDILRYAVLCFAVLICHAMLCYVNEERRRGPVQMRALKENKIRIDVLH